MHVRYVGEYVRRRNQRCPSVNVFCLPCDVQIEKRRHGLDSAFASELAGSCGLDPEHPIPGLRKIGEEGPVVRADVDHEIRRLQADER